MRKKMQKALFIVFFSYSSLMHCASSHVLTFFIDEYPSINTHQHERDKFPHIIQNHASNHGIYTTYYGYKTISDTNGQCTFPLKQNELEFHILVVNNSLPRFMLFNTIHHFIVPEEIDYAYYSVSQKEDEKLQITFWDVQKSTLPKDRHIPLDTITIYAHPDEIYVPTGVSVTQKSPHLVLPTIYAKNHIKLSQNVITFLDYSEFFAPIERGIKREQSDVSTMI
ncbi:hypothetical protein K9K77_00500 [Candidatus Babeliales bacterium]|nr:hypothetical protein [Candidatus Babeliales bacterium]